MTDFILANWSMISARAQSPTPAPATPRAPPPLVKSLSTPHFARQHSAHSTAPAVLHNPEHTMDMDTRTRTPSPPASMAPEDSLTILSTKLVNAINHQTNLDDALQQTRHELEHARAELGRVRAQKKDTDDMIAGGAFVRKAQVEGTMAKLRQDLATERAAREAAERAKKETEGELEGLTTALFEEANTMVAAARRNTEAVERRAGQLRTQLADTELLLASQTEQLHDLKGVMERMDRASDPGGDSSVPSTPVNATTAVWDALQLAPAAAPADVAPDHPLHFAHLLVPVMRTDIAAYTDFQDLLALARRSAAPHSRQNSSGAGNLSSASQTNLHNSSPSLPGAFSSFSSSANNSPSSSSNPTTSAPPLKDSKFYKRILIEDLDPTLRLDLAPGLSFLSRRTVLASLLAGTLVVEPLPPSKKHLHGPAYPCALCGETRKNAPCRREHRFRASEDEGAARYPVCGYCLNRVRAAGDFIGFLRCVREGLWRGESEGEVRGAWEEAVRLRERMFWARMGGGVVPVVHLPVQTLPLRGLGGKGEAGGSPGSTGELRSGRGSLESSAELAGNPGVGVDGADTTNSKEEITAAPAAGSVAKPARDGSFAVQRDAAVGDAGGLSGAALLAPDLGNQGEDELPATPFEDALQHADPLGGHADRGEGRDGRQLQDRADMPPPPVPVVDPAQLAQPTEPAQPAQPLDPSPTPAQAPSPNANPATPTVNAPTPPPAPSDEPPPLDRDYRRPVSVFGAMGDGASLPLAQAERRLSGVQARVRAMEAKRVSVSGSGSGSGGGGGGVSRVPGSFE
ncbi:hypothetical protein LTR08_000455 [Meristemomyces frigidus]|nr:hypothetical protein LTR08_000455 [Meristemomyces frigidus]